MTVQRGDSRWGRFLDYLDDHPTALGLFGLAVLATTLSVPIGAIVIVQWATS